MFFIGKKSRLLFWFNLFCIHCENAKLSGEIFEDQQSATVFKVPFFGPGFDLVGNIDHGTWMCSKTRSQIFVLYAAILFPIRSEQT